jgi:EmrB/QacA subfamily drug resistance transporter
MRTVALIVVSLAFIMDLLDSTIVNIAIPSIRLNLLASYSAIQWIVAGYSLAFALLLITGGRMGDVFGYKKVFMVGVAGFTIASLLSGLSVNASMLIVARFLQGSMAALMVPQVISLMQVMYKPEERGAINGLFGAMGGLAASLGPIISGLLLKANLFNWDWRPIFLINIPVGVIGLIAAARYLPDGKSPHPLKLDFVGTFIVMVGLLLLVFPLIQGREYNWPAWSFIMMAASVPVFVVFAWWQKHKDKVDGSPLVLPALFKARSFITGLIINMVFESAMLGFFLTFGLFLQIGLGFSPIHAALTGLPIAFGIALTMATLGQKVIPKLGRKSIAFGTIIMAAGLITTTLVLHAYTLQVNSWQLLPGLLLVGIGMGFVFGALFAAVLNGVDPHHAGSASGVLNAVQQVGGAVGIAVVGVIFFGQLSGAAGASFNQVSPSLATALSSDHISAPVQSVIINGSKQCFIDRSEEQDSTIIPASCKQASSSGLSTKQLGAVITKTAIKANSTNFDNAFRWATIYEICLLAFTLGISFMLPAKFKVQAFSEL